MLNLPARYGSIVVDHQTWPISFTIQAEDMRFEFNLNPDRYARLISQLSFLTDYKSFNFDASADVHLTFTQLPDQLMIRSTNHISGNSSIIYLSSVQLVELVKTIGLGFDVRGQVVRLGDVVVGVSGQSGTVKGLQFFEVGNEFRLLKLIVPELSNLPIDPQTVIKEDL